MITFFVIEKIRCE